MEDRMTKFNATVLKKDNKKEFVVLPYEDFLKIQEELENYEDLKTLREAKKLEAELPTISLLEVKRQWGIN